MDTHLAYCSACDCQVELALMPGYTPEPGVPVPPEAMLCLAHGDTCTGMLCPLFGTPTEQMSDALRRSGLRTHGRGER